VLLPQCPTAYAIGTQIIAPAYRQAGITPPKRSAGRQDKEFKHEKLTAKIIEFFCNKSGDGFFQFENRT
jgi:hypothetical protein